MNKDLQLWNSALTALERGEQCVLLVVVESIGSSPGRAGFKALVTSGGELYGSIGGGSMEHKLVELARSKIHPPKTCAGSPEAGRDPAINDLVTAGSSARDPAEVLGWSPLLKRQVHRAEEPADRSGMICSGEQTVAFYPLGASHRELLVDIVEAVRNSSEGILAFDQTGISIRITRGSGPPAVSPEMPPDEVSFLHPSEVEWRYTEPIIAQPRIVILGAGHVGLALSRTMHQLGFHVHLMDDRADLNTMAANQWALECSVVDYGSIGQLITDDPDLYVVLVSFGYRTDDILVRQLIRKKLKYLGMMGSAEKIKKLFADLRKDGFTEDEIAGVRAPIGLPIHSKTPEEIAVSIAAEIIGVKNNISPDN